MDTTTDDHARNAAEAAAEAWVIATDARRKAGATYPFEVAKALGAARLASIKAADAADAHANGDADWAAQCAHLVRHQLGMARKHVAKYEGGSA